jgi:hypothetical protein
MSELSPFFAGYLGAWSTAMLVALLLMLRRRRQLSLFGAGYRGSLFVPWKVITFLAAAVPMSVMAPYTGDPTWDWFDAAMMSLLTFLTAPWAVGVLYRRIRGVSPWPEVYLAACLWMFSASWCYDLYILLRDGSYPITWSANIVASSILYLCAGLMWNLEWRPERGVIFGFMAQDWPRPPLPGSVRRLMIYALPFMLLVTAMIVPFLLDHMGWW